LQTKYRGHSPYIFFSFELENSGRVNLGKKIERGSILHPARAARGPGRGRKILKILKLPGVLFSSPAGTSAYKRKTIHTNELVLSLKII
jgi:hypothetical protein